MEKQQYRKFAIKDETLLAAGPNDYGMMAEVLERRYGRLKKEDAVLPDIILVDGGVGHLNVLVEVVKKLGLEGEGASFPTLCAIAKGEERDKGLERIFVWRVEAQTYEQLPITFNSPLIFMLQRVRDEAHRFAITFHRQKRSKTMNTSGLDAVPGVGGKRKKALMMHFGSADGVKNAGVEDLCRVPGISKALAEEIYGYFRQE